jgi:hypothetical protein
MKLRLIWFFSAFFIVLAGMAIYFWDDRAQVETKLVDTLIRKISPKLPFQIESYQLARNLRSLELKILWNGNEISLAGPLSLKWLGKGVGWQAQYDPLVQVGETTSFHIQFNIDTPTDFLSVKRVEATVKEINFAAKPWGVETKNPAVNFVWDNTGATLHFQADTIAWANPVQKQEAVSIQKFAIDGVANDLKELSLVDLHFTADDAEILWNSFYTDLTLHDLPFHLQIHDKKSGHLDIERLAQRLSENTDFSADFDENHVTWQTEFLPLPALVALAEKSFPSDWIVKKGKIKTAGTFSIQSSSASPPVPTTLTLEEASVDVQQASARSAENEMAVQGLSFSTHYHRRAKTNLLTLAVKDFFYHHFVGHLAATEVKWNKKSFQTEKELPLTVDQLPLKMGTLQATFTPEFKLTTAIDIPSAPINNFTQGFCLDPKKLPPATAEVHFNELNFGPGMVDPTGKLTVQLFQGKIDLNDVGFYDLNTEIPEIDFDADWSGIGLQAIGDWIGFGEMKGNIEGYAHDVVFQSFLPTQYSFKIQVSPLDPSSSAHVDFSPEAMKNVVKVFTGENLDQEIPGIAGWFMFGWPSHLLGGYDVYYAGIKLDSQDGKILVQTLDPDAILKEERKHFVLYGPRFKMPIKAPTYPLLLDATAMSNFVHQFFQQLVAMKAEKDAQKEKTSGESADATSISCDPPQI